MRTFSATRPPAKKTRASVLVHGLTGAGKTLRALTGGKPLVICTEPKAEAHVLRINPQAACWVPESCQDLESIFEWLGKPELLEQGFTRIVLDSYTELTEAMPNWILRKQAQDVGIEIGRKISIEEYRPIGEWGIAVIRAIQLSGLPSIIITRSDVKKTGLLEKIVPAGLGSSARNLSAQLVPTVEARFDTEMDAFIWDSRPDEYSQRCGLLWVPPVWTGTADEFLALVESDNTAGATATAPHVSASPTANAEPARSPEGSMPAAQPPSPAPQGAPTVPPQEWVQAMVTYADLLLNAGVSAAARAESCRLLEAKGPSALDEVLSAIEHTRAKLASSQLEPTTVGGVIAQLPPLEKPPVSQLAENTVDQIADGKASPVFISPEEWGSLEDLLRDHKVDRDSFWRFCVAEGHAVAPADGGTRRFDRMTTKAFTKLEPILATERRRAGLIAYIKTKYGTPTSSPQPATAA